MSSPPQQIFWLTRGAATSLCAEAARLKCRPNTLAAALVNGALSGGLIDAILDGDRPAKLAGGRPRDPVFGLTELQHAGIYLIGENAGADGYCRLAFAEIGRLVGADRRDKVTALIKSLEARDMVAASGEDGS